MTPTTYTVAPKARQRVLLLGSYAPSLINFRGQLIAAMVARGHEVHVGAPDIDAHTASALQVLGAEVHETEMARQGTGFLADLAYMKILTGLVKDLRPDLVVTYTIKPNIWGAFAAARGEVRSVAIVTGLGFAFTETGDAEPTVSHVHQFKKTLVQRVARRLYCASTGRNARVIFQNPDDREDFIAAGCLADRGKVCMINGSGVDLTQFRPIQLPTAPNFLMITRILGAKGVREYAKAALSVKKTHPQARFRLVGFFDKGPDSISDTEVAKWVAAGLEYLGPLDDVRTAIAESRIYVLPSYREGTPRSVLEAMAMGRPVITSDAPGCRETVRDGVNGYLVPVRDPEALAARMRDMIDHPARTKQMGEESLRIAREKYDVHKVNKQLMGYLGLLD